MNPTFRTYLAPHCAALCGAAALVLCAGCGAQSEEVADVGIVEEVADEVPSVPSEGGPSDPAPADASIEAVNPPAVAPGCEVVTFGWPAVEDAVRFYARIPSGPIRGIDLLDPIGIELEHGSYAEDLSGMECIPLLNYVEAPLRGLKTIEALRGLPLTQLVVSANEIRDLSPLSGSETLGYLAASSNEIADLSNFDLPPPVERPPIADTVHIELQLNPIGEADVAHLCEKGWSVGWGPAGDFSVCNEHWIWRAPVGGAR